MSLIGAMKMSLRSEQVKLHFRPPTVQEFCPAHQPSCEQFLFLTDDLINLSIKKVKRDLRPHLNCN